MIRVLQIIDTMGSGGVERRRLSMAKLLDKSKFELRIICTNVVGNLKNEFTELGVEVNVIGDLRSFYDIKQHRKVIAIINAFIPHIIHGAVFEGVTMASINGFLKRVPIIILEETSDPQNRRFKGHLLMKLLSLTSNKVIGVSPACVYYLQRKLLISPKKAVLITNGVSVPEISTDVFKQKVRENFKIKKDEIVIGSVGRMSSDSHKRFSDLIKAFALLIQKGIKAKLILVGDGPEKNNYFKLVEECQITKHVIFAGYQDNVNDFYSVFDIFSLVSAYEAFGLVLAEAMLHKLPIVATNVGGIPFIIEDNKNGFLVNKFDVNAIASKLEMLSNDENLRKEFGLNGYKKALSDYTEERYIQNIETLYYELLHKKSIYT
jgi:glycosyltransferase involved in cell wall biosynthesis